jgi:hypothetical protein
MKLLGGNWSKGDLLALIGVLAAILAIPRITKLFHLDSEVPSAPVQVIAGPSSARYELKDKLHMVSSISPEGYFASLAPTGQAKPAADSRAFFTAPETSLYHVSILTKGSSCPNCYDVIVVLYRGATLTHEQIQNDEGRVANSLISESTKDPNWNYSGDLQMNKGENLWLTVHPCGDTHCAGPVDVYLTTATATITW